MTARGRRRFTLHRFWAALRLPFVEVGGEWKRKSVPARRAPSRKTLEARIRAEIQAEERAAETPVQQMLREVEEDSARKFRRALKRSEPVEIGVYGLVRAIAGNERKRRGKPPG
jgi:hypothetical protein